MDIYIDHNTVLKLLSLKKYKFWNKLFVLFLFVFSSAYLNSQVVFQETFNGTDGTTSGTSNGVNWSSSCPDCLSGDYWEIKSGVFEGNDTNGEAVWITDTPIDISNCEFIEISFDIESVGTMEGCGTGCNSVDWIGLQYGFDGAGWEDPSNSYNCSGPCADVNVVASDDVSLMTYSTGCIPAIGNDLKLKIIAQCWSSSEYWRIDNITVTCSSPNSGTNSNLDICSSSNPINLFDQIAVNTTNGGTWSGPSVLTGGDLGTFNPSIMIPGDYTYTLGNSTCTASEVVTVNVISTGNAGTNSTIKLCNKSASIDLFNALGGNPDSNGAWSGPSLLTGGNLGTFDPTTMSGGTYTYTVGSSPCENSASVTIQLNVIGNVEINRTIDVCSNSSTLNLFNELDGNPEIGGTWTGPSVLSGGDLGVFDPVIMNPGKYIYTFGDAPCEVSTSVTVNINLLDDASFSTSNYCEGNDEANSIVITGLSNGVFSFNPIPNDGASINPITGVITNGVGGTEYTIQYSTNGNCPQSTTQTVSVYKLPDVETINFSLCIGDSAELKATGADTYEWDNGVGVGQNHIVSPSTDIIYTVTGSDVHNCQNTSQSIVTVNSLPEIEAGEDKAVCSGSLATLSAEGGDSYSWTNGVINNIPFYPQNNYTYFVTGVDVNGCQNRDSMSISIVSSLTPSFYSDNLIGCAPFTTTFYNNTVGNYSNCVWNVNGDILNGCDSINYTFNNSGLYDVSLTLESSNGCVSAADYSDYIYVEEGPIADFSYGQIETTSSNSKVTFSNESVGATEFKWFFGDGDESSEFEPIHEYDFSDLSSYTISLLAFSDKGCIDSAKLDIIRTESSIYYVPNSFTPNGDELNNTFNPVFTEGFDPYDYHLSIYNRWGDLIFESQNTMIGWDGSYLGVIQLNGTYIWKIDFSLSTSDKRVSLTGHVNLLR